MSYLNALRLHFSGRFQANVSTVNNDPGHFDNAGFQSSYQQMQSATALNGWFNPQGDAVWRLLGCRVTSAWTSAGEAAASDPVLACRVADSDSRAPAKLVDLDPEQQLVSEIWGLQVRIADANGNTLLCGNFEPAAFTDIWDRATASAGGDTIAGAMYQSVLSGLEWGDVSSSAFLTQLKAAAGDGLLSIKFNVDSFNLSFQSPDFMTGRIVGTIGPASADEPKHLVLGRQFMATSDPDSLPPQNFFRPNGNINFCAGVVDDAAGLIYLDLGNALPTGVGDSLLNMGDLQVQLFNPANFRSATLATVPSLGATGYSSDPSWYARTAGVVVLPIPEKYRAAVQRLPLCLVGALGRINESASGTFVRADTYVFRVSPKDTVAIDVYATQFGLPMSSAVIAFAADASQLQPSNSVNPNDVPPVAIPLTAIGFANATTVLTATTGTNGKATLTLTMDDPGTPRYFNNGTNYGIDGQVYGVRPSFQDADDNAAVNPWNFVSILLWSGYVEPVTPAWADVQPIFQQYANLYPVMLRFLDMGNEASVIAHADLLTLAFGLNPADPNAMPVTRDLSPAKRSTILAWLAQQQRQRGHVPPPVHTTTAAGAPAMAANDEVKPEGSARDVAAAAVAAPAVAAPVAKAAVASPPPGASLELESTDAVAPSRGGKAEAAARRQILQKPARSTP